MRGTIYKQWFVNRDIYVYLPPSYESSSAAAYPVVYIQDGDYLIMGAAEQLEERFDCGVLQELILVGIEPIDRNDEYTPWYTDPISDRFPTPCQGQGETYLRFVVEQLKPYIDGACRTKREPEATGIAGASYGGLITLYAAYLFPEVFGRFGLLSASFWYEGMIKYVRSQPLPSNDKRLFMYVGSEEGAGKTTIQMHMVPYTREAHQQFLAGGFPGKSMKFVEEPGGVHTHEFFIKYFPDAMEWLYPGTDETRNPRE
ncbi:alpha/beta hydrolase [Paenibacillus sp. NPDC056579]|uniref:alpha/beta hydrolase n=1 Tax=Paenibacillus sp. NPDC056579 TaxID=3345871 RepID=UPI00369960ED